MCEPATITAVMTGVSTAMTAYSVHAQGQAAKASAKYNARLAENEAQAQRNAGNEAENAHREKVQQLISMQRVQGAASGVDINSGSALQMQTDAALQGEVDALRIRRGVDDAVAGSLSEAQLMRFQGRTAARNANLNAAGTLIGQGTAIGSKWYADKNAQKKQGIA